MELGSLPSSPMAEREAAFLEPPWGRGKYLGYKFDWGWIIFGVWEKPPGRELMRPAGYSADINTASSEPSLPSLNPAVWG